MARSIKAMFGIKKLYRSYRLYRMGCEIVDRLRGVEMTEKLRSRKFWVTVVSGLVVLVNGALGSPIQEETMQQFLAAMIALVLGQAFADGMKKG